MKRVHVDSLPDRLVAFDTETHALRPWLPIPRLVCGSLGWLEPGPKIQTAIVDRQGAIEMFCRLVDDPSRFIGGANLTFDFLVLAAELLQIGMDDIVAIILDLLESERVFDALHIQELDAIADGIRGKDPRTGQELKNPATGKFTKNYSLATCVDLVLGRTDAKANDDWKLRYHELENIPLAQWPQAAIDYPKDDGYNTTELLLAQAGHLPRVGMRHRYTPRPGEQGNGGRTCLDCGSSRFSDPCLGRRRARNFIDLAKQTHTAFALGLGSSWGFKVDQAYVDIIEAHATEQRAAGIQKFIDAKLIREDGTEDQGVVKRMVAEAYGATEPCPVCKGTGKVPSSKVKTLRCPDCKGHCLADGKPGPSRVKWQKEHPDNQCATCASTGKIPHPNPDMVTCFTWELDEGGMEVLDTDGERVKAKTCDGTGYVVPTDTPRSEKEGIGKDRDTLAESGHETLMAYAEFKEDDKILKDYTPFLHKARMPEIGHFNTCPSLNSELRGKAARCTCPGPYKDIALTLRPQILLDTGRVSYQDYIQLMPRKPGYIDRETKKYVPSLRECFIARDGYVFSSEDFTAGELVTHAQSALWITGQSLLADALNNNLDPHAAFACTLLGIDLSQFDKKIPMHAAARQIGKGWNFGKPGGASDSTVVIQQRTQGPDTPCPHGPFDVENDNKEIVRGYKGMRICILMGATDRCGERKTTKVHEGTEWERTIKPTCVECLRCAEQLGAVYKRQWPENDKYFKYIKRAVADGMVIEEAMLRRWPHWREYYTDGEQLNPGEIIQHVSGRIRGGLTFTSAANSMFQGLLGDVAKAALRRVVRECYDARYVVPLHMYETSIATKYAGAQSPLFGSRVIGFFHDELFGEHPESNAADAATRIAEVMIDELAHYCPDLRQAAKVKPTLQRRWYKQAEPTYVDAEGRPCKEATIGARLVPWEPEALAA